MNTEEKYWSNRYQEKQTGWDIGEASAPLKVYINQLENKNQKILIPGAGNAHEAEYLFEQGFKNVFVLDISKQPLDTFKKRVPDFLKENLLHVDFFELSGTFDLIIEQTFFCSLEPTKENRNSYAKKMHQLLANKGQLVGLWFCHDLNKYDDRPFGGSKKEYLEYLNPYFETKTFDECYNSIKPREGNELFGIFIKK